MKLCRLFILAIALLFNITVAAEPIATMLQFAHQLDGRSITQISLKLISTDFDSPPSMGVILPLYSTDTGTRKWNPMRNAEQRRPFCERRPNGCLAFGMLLGIGITYFVVEAANDADGDTRIHFTSGSADVTVNNAR